MNRDDIMRMAREALLPSCHLTHLKALVRFAALVAAAEREACAKVCDQFDANNPYIGQAKACASAMRARGNK